MFTLKVITLLGLVLMVSGIPLNQSGGELAGESDQLVSGTTLTKSIVPDPQAAASEAKHDLKTSDSFGLGYYLPFVTPALVKYHYPLLYYHPAAYLHSIRHHGFGGYGFYSNGHTVIH